MGEGFELEDIDDSDFTDEESSEEETEDALDELLRERMEDMSEEEKAEMEKVNQEVPSIRSAGGKIANRSAVARADASSPSISDFSDADTEGLTKEDLEDLEDGLQDIADAVRDLKNTPGKGPLYTRMKFWTYVMSATIATGGAVVAVVSLVLRENARESGEPDPTDTDEISDEMKELLKEKADEWKALSLNDLCDRMSGFAETYAASMLAQLTAIRDLKLLVATPPSAALNTFTTSKAPGIAKKIEQSYASTDKRPRFKAIYDEIKAVDLSANPGTGPAEPLTVPEAVVVMELAVAAIYKMIKAMGH